MSSASWWRRPVIDWEAMLLGTVLSVLLLAVLAVPVALVVAGLIDLAHRVDPTVPVLRYGAVWALVYAAGLVRAFMHVRLEFAPRH